MSGKASTTSRCSQNKPSRDSQLVPHVLVANLLVASLSLPMSRTLPPMRLATLVAQAPVDSRLEENGQTAQQQEDQGRREGAETGRSGEMEAQQVEGKSGFAA